jgi:hypothetical protein
MRSNGQAFKPGIEERDSEIEGKVARVAMSELGSERVSIGPMVGTAICGAKLDANAGMQ